MLKIYSPSIAIATNGEMVMVDCVLSLRAKQTACNTIIATMTGRDNQ